MIRLATTDDLEQIADLRHKMFDNIGTTQFLVDDFLKQTRDYYSEQYRLSRCVHAVKEENGIIIGCAGGLIRTDDFLRHSFKAHEYGYVMDVYVEPEYRRRGIARSLVETILSWLSGKAIKTIKLDASKLSGTLYQGIGFKPSIEMAMQASQKTTADQAQQ